MPRRGSVGGVTAEHPCNSGDPREFRSREERPIVATLQEVAEGGTGVSVGEVDESTARGNLDRLARRFLGMSGEDFLRLRTQGSFGPAEQQPGFTRVLAVATLLD